MLNKILVSTLACCIVLLLTSSCVAESSCGVATISVGKDPSHSIPLYFSEHKHEVWIVDWEYGFKEGFGEVEVNRKWGFINSRGEIAIKPKFDEVRCFHEGIAVVRSGTILDHESAVFLGLSGRLDYIDKEGRIIHRYIGDNFSEGLAPVCVTGTWGTILSGKEKMAVIDTMGEVVIPARHWRFYPFSEGLAIFEDPNFKSGYINTKGEVVIKPRYLYASDFSEGMAWVTKKANGKYGFINKRGEEVIPFMYDMAGGFSEGLAAVKKNKKCGYIDRKGKLVIPYKFDAAKGFSEGYAAVIVEATFTKDKYASIIRGKIGYIDINGEYVIEPKFEYVRYWRGTDRKVREVGVPFVSFFSEGLAAVMVGGKWGYIDSQGDFVIEPQFDFAGPFTEGFAKVAVGDKLGYIDKQGKYIWKPTR